MIFIILKHFCHTIFRRFDNNAFQDIISEAQFKQLLYSKKIPEFCFYIAVCNCVFHWEPRKVSHAVSGVKTYADQLPENVPACQLILSTFSTNFNDETSRLSIILLRFTGTILGLFGKIIGKLARRHSKRGPHRITIYWLIEKLC